MLARGYVYNASYIRKWEFSHNTKSKWNPVPITDCLRVRYQANLCHPTYGPGHIHALGC